MIFVAVASISSQMRNASGSIERRLAESSSVRSSIDWAAFCQATCGITDSARDSESIFSALMGLRLNGMADEPTCLEPKGSDNSPIGGDWSTLISRANLWSDAPRPASTETTL